MEPNLPNAEFAFPGPLRDALVAAILSGSKTSTTSIALQYDVDDDPLPVPGSRSVLVDSAQKPVAILEVTHIRLVPLGSVDLAHVLDEGEGHESVAQWRAAHEEFWHGEQFRGALGDPGFTVDDATVAVLERFRVVEDVADGVDAGGEPPA